MLCLFQAGYIPHFYPLAWDYFPVVWGRVGCNFSTSILYNFWGGYFADVVQLGLSISHPHLFFGLVVWRQPLSQQDYKTEAKAEDIPQTFGRHTSSKQLSGMDKEPNGVYQQYRRLEGYNYKYAMYAILMDACKYIRHDIRHICIVVWSVLRRQQFKDTYLDPPRVSNFSPQVCFWWLRGPNFRPLEDSGKYTELLPSGRSTRSAASTGLGLRSCFEVNRAELESRNSPGKDEINKTVKQCETLEENL